MSADGEPAPGDDWPDTANVAVGLAGVAAGLARIPSDAGELARARRVGGLTIAAGLPTGVLSGGGAWPSQTWTSARYSAPSGCPAPRRR